MEKKLWTVVVDDEHLARLLVVMAKADGIATLHASLNEEHNRFKRWDVYFESDYQARTLLTIYCENAGLRGHLVWKS